MAKPTDGHVHPRNLESQEKLFHSERLEIYHFFIDRRRVFRKMPKSSRVLSIVIGFSTQRGGIAQLVARLNGIQKVRGSTPLTSTIFY